MSLTGKIRKASTDFTSSVEDWWSSAEFLTMGEKGHENVFYDDPDFVKELRYSKSIESTLEVAALSIQWWNEFHNDDYGRLIFDDTPEFIEKANDLLSLAGRLDKDTPEP